MADNENIEETELDQGFNDDELKDIMAEIEDLEKDLDVGHDDLSLDASTLSDEIVETISENKDEIEMSLSDNDEEIVENLIEDLVSENVDEIVREVDELDDNVVSLIEVKKEVPALESNEVEATTSPFGVSFEGEGTYHFKMSFPVGDQTLHFEVHPDKTFELDFNNIKFSVDGNACIVHMEGGATFNLPLSSSNDQSLKINKAS